MKNTHLSHPAPSLHSLAPRLQPTLPVSLRCDQPPFSLRGEVERAGYPPLSQRQKPGSALLRSRREQAGAGVQVAAGEGTGRSRPGVSVSPCAHSACAWTSCTRSSASSAKAMARTTSRCAATCWPMPSLWPSSSSVSGRGHAGPPPLRLATGQGPTCFSWFCPPVC